METLAFCAVGGPGALVLDASGGAGLFHRCGNADGGRRLVLCEPHQRALDLHSDPLLEVLDLRGCGAGEAFHLQLDRLPALREVWLPLNAAGAVIHLYSQGLPRSVRFHGPVSHFDADWQQGQVLLPCAQGVWDEVVVHGSDAGFEVLESLCQPQALKLLLAPEPLGSGSATLHATGTLYIADTGALEHLRVEGPVRLWIGQGRGLKSLSLVEALEFEGGHLDSLEQLDAGRGQERTAELDFRQSDTSIACDLKLRGRMTSLRLLDTWRQVQLHTPGSSTSPWPGPAAWACISATGWRRSTCPRPCR